MRLSSSTQPPQIPVNEALGTAQETNASSALGSFDGMPIKNVRPSPLLALWRKATRNSSPKSNSSFEGTKVSDVSAGDAKTHQKQRTGILEKLRNWANNFSFSFNFSFPWSSKKSTTDAGSAGGAENGVTNEASCSSVNERRESGDPLAEPTIYVGGDEAGGNSVTEQDHSFTKRQGELKAVLKEDHREYESIMDEDSEYDTNQEQLADVSKLADKLLIQVNHFERFENFQNAPSKEVKGHLSQAKNLLNQVKGLATQSLEDDPGIMDTVQIATKAAIVNMHAALDKMVPLSQKPAAVPSPAGT